MITVTRYHDISAGHRVYGHESKCKHLHGHNYRIHFTITSPNLDQQGRVIDFGVIKSNLCQWLEDNWDHKTILWEHDPILTAPLSMAEDEVLTYFDGINSVPFNPTAENMATYLLETIGPQQLDGTECLLIKVVVEETAKCSATAEFSFLRIEDELRKIRTAKLYGPNPPENYDLPF